ncbi:hypothetical protein FACS189429_8440 [Bacteroidia bacterium]|nr:hypothetical protein FACS189429_8440 [Bacteroidia bacterium]
MQRRVGIFCYDNNLPEIDFETKTLLLAHGWSISCFSDMDITVTKIDSVYTVQVDIVPDAAALSSEWKVAILIDKVSSDNVFNVVVNDGRDTLTTGLQGSRWKLAGIVDPYSYPNGMQILEPVECNECYTLEFQTDFVATGLCLSNEVHIDLAHLMPDVFMGDVPDMDRWNDEWYDVTYFRRGLIYTESFETTATELKLFHDLTYKSRYLLFNKIQ